ncbi:MAG: hypothetical protein MZV65_38830 [Chromatiales bacterium]|nr:hypothetical protein [Chromatiales bacterium]
MRADEALLERLVALNAERAAEEARGLVRWLRPEFQDSRRRAPRQQADRRSEGEAGRRARSPPVPAANGAGEKLALARRPAGTGRAPSPACWPESPVPLDADAVAARYTGRGTWKKRLPQLLETLVALGRARAVEGGYFGVQP